MLDWWLSDFLKQCQHSGLLVAEHMTAVCCALGGTAMRGLAQSFLKSILALWARDNLENIIQNSTFQHVSSIKGGFLSRVSTKATWPKNAQIRLKKRGKVHFFFQTKASLATWVDKYAFYVCALTAHVHLHKYELELDALNKFQFFLLFCVLVVFLLFWPFVYCLTLLKARSYFPTKTEMAENGTCKVSDQLVFSLPNAGALKMLNTNHFLHRY